MKWIQQGNSHLSAPYRLVSNLRGFEVWLNTKSKYGVLAREISSLAKAKEFAEKHARKKAADSGAEPAAAVDGSGD